MALPICKAANGLFCFQSRLLLLCHVSRHMKGAEMEARKHIRVRTFGFFDLFVDGKVVIFTNRRAKELLAILVDNRGGMVPTEKIIDVFWPEEPESEGNKSIFRKALVSLKKTLFTYDIQHILISERGQKGVVSSELDCDYYRALVGDAGALSEYFGEYMVGYSWAEKTNKRICAIAEKEKAGVRK